jgi:ureidoglycolate lyase
MASITLKTEPLTRENFAPYGDVIETEGAKHFPINAGTIERFHDLAQIDLGPEEGARTLLSIAQCNVVAKLPCPVPLVERHPLGSQAFVPFDATPVIVVVAPPGEEVSAASLRAFISNGHQGINYHRGVWHLPLIALDKQQQFLIVDRGGAGNNCEEFHFKDDEIQLTR